ncbi:hypothetical protein BC826DRAFT_1019139 [Russula brevipes]|nr:hypothetical protein BC826DRAFT_1019139 [Russula brevipes]
MNLRRTNCAVGRRNEFRRAQNGQGGGGSEIPKQGNRNKTKCSDRESERSSTFCTRGRDSDRPGWAGVGQRRALEMLAEAKGNVSSGIRWHARKMEVSGSCTGKASDHYCCCVGHSLLWAQGSCRSCTAAACSDGKMAFMVQPHCLSGLGETESVGGNGISGDGSGPKVDY